VKAAQKKEPGMNEGRDSRAQGCSGPARWLGLLPALIIGLSPAPGHADKYAETIKVFHESGQSARFFEHCYGYAVFPTIGKGGIGIGGAHGSGHVYARGAYTGDASMTQVTLGFQLGGQAYSQIVFFEDQRAFDEFTSGNFEFGAQATAVAITAGASAQASTGGTGASAGTSRSHTKTAGEYYKGMAVFTAAKAGLMYEASIGGQKFSYKPKK
jgi:lipid-binding SYLF domain-containing protein